MIPVNDLRAGAYFKDEGQPYIVLEYKHVKMGRGNANIKIKARNLRSGAVLERSFLSGGKVEDIEVSRNKVQFLYADQKQAFFMDPKTFEQFDLGKDVLGESFNFLKEGLELDLIRLDDEILGAELPNSVLLEVAETGPSERGDSTGSVTKPAVLETGYSVQVPMFIKKGDLLKIDTRNGTYIERAR